MLVDALADRIRGTARTAGTGAVGYVATETKAIVDASNRARASWPVDAARLVRMPVAERWRWVDDDPSANERAQRIALWRGGSHVGDDARAAAVAYARLARPVALSLIEVDADGGFGAFGPELPLLVRLLDPSTPATVAAVDAADGGAPWLTLTLAAVLDAERLAVVLPPGADPADVARPGSALAAVLARARVPVVCHVVG